MSFSHIISKLLLSVAAIILAATTYNATAQSSGIPGNLRMDGQGRPMGAGSKGNDSLKQRDNNEDSITIYYRLFDSSRILRPDSSVTDYTKRYPLPADFVWLGSLGNAAHSVLFSPNTRAGFDAGFHGYDIYRATLEGTKQYQTTRAYTTLDYLLGPRTEQTIKVLHTQNIKPLWNAVFDFRFISMPGHFKNSNSAHSNIKLYTTFSTKDRRYSGFAMYLTNRNRISENGGIRSDTFLNNSNTAFNDRFNIPTWIGGDGDFTQNPFSGSYSTATEYKQKFLYIRDQFDIGQRDSIYDADSNVIKRFFPRLRIQHTFYYNNNSYAFTDLATESAEYAKIYQNHYGLSLSAVPLKLKDSWKDLTNEGAIILFPQKTNQDQFLKLGAGLQLLDGSFGAANENFSNTYLLGEYRNRTKNQKWDINANGRLYLAGLNSGDYQAAISLQTDLGAKLGSLRLGFQNINRSPSFVFETKSNFIIQGNANFNKENWTILSADFYLSRIGAHLTGKYFLVSNYTYWADYYRASQQATLQNVLLVGAEKAFKLSKHWNWYADLYLQQATGTAINLPLIYTRQRLAYEGVFFKNLNLSSGVELRYYSAYQADDWSPFNGQWVVQNRQKISNRPDVAAFLHLRIRGLRIFIRAENLNTVNFSNGFSFTKNNLSAPLFPTPGFIFRLGFFWSFVN